MYDLEKILKNINKIIGISKCNDLDKTKIPLLIKIFEKFREDIDMASIESKTLKAKKLQMIEKIDTTFDKEEKKTI